MTDSKQTISELKLKAEGGDIKSQFLLGSAYDKGERVERNHTEAVFWYKKSAEGGNIDALFNLALSYQSGEGVQKDPQKAVKLYMSAASQGDSDSQFNLGEIYENGLGVQKDLEEAEKWYSKAKENGDEEAEHSLIRIKAAKRQRLEEEKRQRLEEEKRQRLEEEKRQRLEEQKKIREAYKKSVSQLSVHSEEGGDYIGLKSSLRTQSEKLYSKTAAKPIHEWHQEEAALIRLLLDYPKRKECLSLATDSSEETKLILTELKKLNETMSILLAAQNETTKATNQNTNLTGLGLIAGQILLDDKVKEGIEDAFDLNEE